MTLLSGESDLVEQLQIPALTISITALPWPINNSMKWINPLTELLKVRFPFVQAPMLGVTTPDMVAAIANAGGLGSLPVGGLAPAKTGELIRQTTALTRNSFAVNLFVHEEEKSGENEMRQMQAFLVAFCAKHGVAYEPDNRAQFPFYSYREQLSILVEHNIKIVSFTFGIPDDNALYFLKQNGVLLIGTATNVAEAKLLEKKGINVITAQGSEAGGHRGSFINITAPPLIGSMCLVPAITRSVNMPVLAAGGIYNSITMEAAMLLGAQGVQVGSAFLCSNESAAIPAYKAAIAGMSECDTVLTRAISGRWARGLSNELIAAIDQSALSIPGYPIQSNLTAAIRTVAQKTNNSQFTSLWAGQSAANAQKKAAAEIMLRIVGEAKA